MNAALVIGYGNPTRSDDGVGWFIASKLNENGVKSLAVQQLLPEHAAEIANFERVIFVDAAVEGLPGTWQSVPVHADPSTPQTDSFTHHLTPAQLLTMSGLLYGHTPEADLITLVGVSFEFGELLSAEVQSVVPDVIGYIRELCVVSSALSSVFCETAYEPPQK